MLGMFVRKPQPSFPPLPAPLPPRKPCTSTSACNQQPQSAFLTILPPEVRNEIYRYAFTLDASEMRSLPDHPLALLVTCHKINHEATNLAFHTYTFPMARNFECGFITLRNQTAHLSTDQTSAISALSFDLKKDYMHQTSGVSNALANAILIFPGLARFEIHVMRGNMLQQSAHYSSQLVGHTFSDPRKDAVEKYSQHWFNYWVLQPVASGHTYSWQTGEKWRIEWPQLDSDFFYAVDGKNRYGEPALQPVMGTEAVGCVRGVHMCVCGCGEVCWLSADLVQETGRRVGVDTIFYGGEERPDGDDSRFSHLKVRLRPGAEPLNVVEGPSLSGIGVSSYAYYADQEYWDRIRRRNWKIDAMWRGLCMGSRKKKLTG